MQRPPQPSILREGKEPLLMSMPAQDSKTEESVSLLETGNKDLDDASLGYNGIINYDGASIPSDESSVSQFSPVRTVPLAFLQVLCILAVEAQLFGEWYANDAQYVLAPGCLLLTLTVTYVICRHEHKRLRAIGYLRFYIKANTAIRNLYFLIAMSTCLNCVIFTFYPSNDPRIKMEVTMDLLISIEMLLALVIIGIYIQLCWHFNSQKALPDAHAWQHSPDHGGPLQAGIRGRGDIVQKQALMIRHFEKQVKTLTDELSKLKKETGFSNNVARRTDFDSLLQAKDAEIRTLKVDRDRLRAENKLVTGDLEELRKTHALVHKEQQDTVAQLEKARNQIRTLEKDKAQIQCLVEVHKETNREMQQLIDSLKTLPSGLDSPTSTFPS